MKQTVLLISLCLLSITSSFPQKMDFPELTGPYLGQKPPGITPEIFAPGTISTAYPDICISFSPDGKEVYYTIGGQPHSVILFMKETGGLWSPPEVAPFSGMYSSECQLSPDGNTMYFCAGIPAQKYIVLPSGESWHSELYIPEKGATSGGDHKPPVSFIKSITLCGCPPIV